MLIQKAWSKTGKSEYVPVSYYMDRATLTRGVYIFAVDMEGRKINILLTPADITTILAVQNNGTPQTGNAHVY